MFYKKLLLLVVFTLGINFLYGQEFNLVVTHNSKTDTIKKGSRVRLAYPSSLLNTKSKSSSTGVMGKLDSISSNKIWLKLNGKRTQTIELSISDIQALKKSTNLQQIVVFGGTYGTLYLGNLLLSNSLDFPELNTFVPVTLLAIPAALITANIILPLKPKKGNYIIKSIKIR